MEPGYFPRSVSFMLEQLQQGLNRMLAYDPQTESALAALEGRVIAVEIREPDLQLFLLPGSQGLRLSTSPPPQVDVTISGRPLALLGMLGRREASQGQVEIRGDIYLAQRLQAILRQVDIDWDEFLARYVGDTAAHRLGRFGRNLHRHLQAAGLTLHSQISEYLLYEQRVLPMREEIDTFSQSVDRLRDDVERTEQRLRRLQQGMSS